MKKGLLFATMAAAMSGVNSGLGLGRKDEESGEEAVVIKGTSVGPSYTKKPAKRLNVVEPVPCQKKVFSIWRKEGWPSLAEVKQRRLEVKNQRRAVNGLPPRKSYAEI